MASAGRVIWLTGLSGSGKTTLATALQAKLPDSILLDGDSLREVLANVQGGYDRESRKKLAFTYARLAGLLACQGFTVIVATISLFHELHAWNRENLPNYLEVFLDVPLKVRQARDPKGLYAGEKKGAIRDMAGSAGEAEFPLKPHLRLTEECGIEESVKLVLNCCDFAG